MEYIFMRRRSARSKLPHFKQQPASLATSKDQTPRQPYLLSHRNSPLPSKLALPRLPLTGHSSPFRPFKLLSPSPKRSIGLLPSLPNVLPIVTAVATVWRSATPQPVRGRIVPSPLEERSEAQEATTQCEDMDFPFSPRACEYDTGNLFVLKMRKIRLCVES